MDLNCQTAAVVETFTGKSINIFEPDPEMIDLADIIQSLSSTCRYNGHSSKFYSVAEHLMLCHDLAINLDYPVSIQKAVLLHDAHEAYIGDIPRPLKRHAFGEGPARAEFALDKAIAIKFDIPVEDFSDQRVRNVDDMALSIESFDLMSLKTVGFKSYLVEVDPINIPEWWNKNIINPAEAVITLTKRFKEIFI